MTETTTDASETSTGTDVGEDAEPVLAISPSALDVVLGARAGEADPEHLALWVEVAGANGNAYAYDIYFQSATDADAAGGDAAYRVAELPVVVPAASVAALRGARLEWSEDDGGGLVIINPNTPPRPAGAAVPTGDLSGPLAQRILAVLDEQVNPAIAAHGGRADLVSVEDDVAYLNLSGGCQGCGMARATLSQGIETALREAVPELRGVVDVTDHAGGLNPYFEPTH